MFTQKRHLTITTDQGVKIKVIVLALADLSEYTIYKYNKENKVTKSELYTLINKMIFEQGNYALIKGSNV